MASVSSLDQDMRNLRMGRYTPQAAKEVREWIESTLNDRIPSGDLLEALKDGVALCKLANLVLPSPGIKFKASPMPFIQMENISHFLKACEIPPLSMPAHDRFLTVDLFEAKDPAQVLQCLTAFSRKAHAIKPSVFRTSIGSRKTGDGGTMSPTSTGGANGAAASWKQPYGAAFGRSSSPTKASSAMPGSARAMSPSLTGGSTGSQGSNAKSPSGPVSSWSKRGDEGTTSPAWNIHQYGYMGGASQGNQGVSFGARRQITSQAPAVPSLAEKEKTRKEKIAEEERQRQQAEDEGRRRIEEEEAQARAEEQRQWEDETRRVRDGERMRMEEQKRQWAEDERRWKEQEEQRRREEEVWKKHLPPQKPRVPSSGVLRGQTLAEYQKEQAALSAQQLSEADETPEQKRVRELEKQLDEARERERQYQAEREARVQRGSRPSTAQSGTPSETSWASDERDYLRQQWQSNRESAPAKSAAAQPGAPRQQAQEQRPLPKPEVPSRALPEPEEEEEEVPALPQRLQPSGSAPSLPNRMQQSTSTSSVPQLEGPALGSSPLGSENRPLPTPDKEFAPYTPTQPQQSRTDRYLSTNTAPSQPAPRVSSAQEAGDTSLEQQQDRDRRLASQQKTKAGGWAGKSLLEREMERERERQREWEQNQQTVKDAPRDQSAGTNAGQSWDVNQYGYMGGDSMNRSSGPGSGIDFGGKRQILGPREMKR